MSTPKRPFSLRLHASVALVALALSAPPALAQLTDLSDEPLAQPASNIKPNVMMILDDSGSMREQYTPDYLGSLFGSAEELCFDSKDSDGDIDSNLLDCEVGDPPMMSPQVNYQYYNPEIRYLPAVNFDGTSRPNMDAVQTSNWTKVPTDNVSTPGKNTFRVNILAMNVGGNAETTSNLISKYPDRAFCTAKGDDHNNASNYPSKCRLNSQYSYPNQTAATTSSTSTARPTTTACCRRNTAPTRRSPTAARRSPPPIRCPRRCASAATRRSPTARAS